MQPDPFLPAEKSDLENDLLKQDGEKEIKQLDDLQGNPIH